MENINHTNRKHALLSASGSSRWLNCTPSARLEEKFQESKRSIYAEEGTLAHEFGDLNLQFYNGNISESVFNKEIKKLRKEDLYSPEMEEEIQKYVDIVLENYKAAKVNTPDAVLLIEERFDFSHIVEDGFGTGDATIIADGILEIDDLKYGKGIRVEAENNPQLKLYGLGALASYDMMYEIHTVRLNIIQPRLNHYSSWDISREDLETWGNRIVKPKAKKAYEGKGVQKAGDWCRFCKVKPMCATLAARNIKLAAHEFKDPHLLTEKQLLEVYKQQPMLVDWVNSVSKYLLDEALKGKNWPGYKLVEGRSNRKWSDEEKVRETLLDQGFDESEYITSKLSTITQIEKNITKDVFRDLLSDYVIKPQGKPTLVDVKDKRQALGVEDAKEVFK